MSPVLRVRLFNLSQGGAFHFRSGMLGCPGDSLNDTFHLSFDLLGLVLGGFFNRLSGCPRSKPLSQALYFSRRSVAQ